MVQVSGDKEIERALKKMGEAGSLKVLRSGMGAALTPIQSEVRAAAPVGDVEHKTYKGRTVAPGFLGRNIKKATKIIKKTSTVIGWVKPGPEAWYGSLKEFGYQKGGTKIPAEPWFYDAADRGAAKSFERYVEQIKKRIIKAFNS